MTTMMMMMMMMTTMTTTTTTTTMMMMMMMMMNRWVRLLLYHSCRDVTGLCILLTQRNKQSWLSTGCTIAELDMQFGRNYTLLLISRLYLKRFQRYRANGISLTQGNGPRYLQPAVVHATRSVSRTTFRGAYTFIKYGDIVISRNSLRRPPLSHIFTVSEIGTLRHVWCW